MSSWIMGLEISFLASSTLNTGTGSDFGYRTRTVQCTVKYLLNNKIISALEDWSRSRTNLNITAPAPPNNFCSPALVPQYLGSCKMDTGIPYEKYYVPEH